MIRFLKATAIGAAGLTAMFSAASANTVSIADGLGTIDCSTSCEAFTLGALALGAEPTAAGLLTSTDAWYYDGTPSNEAHEADRLSILISGATGVFSGTDGTQIGGSGGSDMFSTLAEYIVMKIGNVSVFVKNTSGGMLTIDYTSTSGAGSGLSHYTEFGGVSDVPVPGAIWLMIAGIAGLTGASRKNKAA